MTFTCEQCGKVRAHPRNPGSRAERERAAGGDLHGNGARSERERGRAGAGKAEICAGMEVDLPAALFWISSAGSHSCLLVLLFVVVVVAGDRDLDMQRVRQVAVCDLQCDHAQQGHGERRPQAHAHGAAVGKAAHHPPNLRPTRTRGLTGCAHTAHTLGVGGRARAHHRRQDQPAGAGADTDACTRPGLRQLGDRGGDHELPAQGDHPRPDRVVRLRRVQDQRRRRTGGFPGGDGSEGGGGDGTGVGTGRGPDGDGVGAVGQTLQVGPTRPFGPSRPPALPVPARPPARPLPTRAPARCPPDSWLRSNSNARSSAPTH